MELKKYLQDNKITHMENVSAKHLSTLGCGGNCSLVIYPKNVDEMKLVLDKVDKYYILGNGSNTLFSDNYIEDVIICTKKLKGIKHYNSSLYCGAGLCLKNIANKAKEYGLSGLEKIACIPATLGGAIYMNAGAFGRQIQDLIEYVDVLIDGEIKTLYRNDLKFSYRHSSIMENGGIILGAELKLSLSKSEDIDKEECIYADYKLSTQPQGKSLGCIFKAYNNIPAAIYIEELKMKGYELGDAQISEVHCNFIINKGNCSSNEFISLACLVQNKVKEEFDIDLEAEFKYIGEKNKDILRLTHTY